MQEKITLENLWNELISDGKVPHKYDGYEVIECDGLETKTYGDKYVRLNFISRHKTPKHLLKISVKTNNKNEIDCVTVTSDHVCMIYNKDHFFENTNAKNLNVNDYVSVYDEAEDDELIGTIVKIVDVGTTDEWVYDLEVDDDMHAFYANNILVHNSQFVRIKCISDWMIQKYNLPKRIADWTQEKRQELWDIVEKMVNEKINPFVQNLVHDYCKTNNSKVLMYDLEYMCDCGLYETKKHYAIHKIFEEGDAIDKIKYSGIELKKATLSPIVKDILKYVYEHALLDADWNEQKFKAYILESYEKFCKLSINDIAPWKGYSTARESVGFLQMQKGSTAIASASTYWNQLIEKFKLGKKYDEIRIGDKVRFCYIKPTNEFGIEYIAFPNGQWPKEFDTRFKVDYELMFQKCVLQPLGGYMTALKVSEKIDPSNQMEFDINEL